MMFLEMQRIVDQHNKVVITDRMWARVLASTNQPSFLKPKELIEFQRVEAPSTQLLEGENSSSSSGNK